MSEQTFGKAAREYWDELERADVSKETDTIAMWTRDDIIAEAKKVEREYLANNQSTVILRKLVIDAVARLVLDNAATIAEQYGDPEIEAAINALKTDFPLEL